MIVLLTYISLIAGGLLVLLLLIGIIGGLDLDFDLDADAGGSSDVGVGVGFVKGGLTFLSIGSWVLKMLLLASTHPIVAVVGGVAAGAVAVYLMIVVVNYLMRYEENVNWNAGDAVYRSGKVYLRIPPAGEGIVRINVKGGLREFKARSTGGVELPTGTSVTVDDLGPEEVLLVSATK